MVANATLWWRSPGASHAANYKPRRREAANGSCREKGAGDVRDVGAFWWLLQGFEVSYCFSSLYPSAPTSSG